MVGTNGEVSTALQPASKEQSRVEEKKGRFLIKTTRIRNPDEIDYSSS